MTSRIDQTFGAATGRWTAAAGRHAGLVLALTAAFTVGLFVYTTRNLGVNADINQMFSDEVHYRALEIAYNEQFPAVAENVLVVLDGRTPEIARAAAARLADRMAAAPELFRNVFLPQGPFFEDHALLYLDTDALHDFADRMARVQPYLAGLARDGTLRGLAELLARGIDAVRDGDVTGDELIPMFNRFGAAVHAWEDGRPYEVSWAEVVAGHELDVDARRRFIIARPVLHLSEFVAAEQSLKALRTMAGELDIDEEHGVRMRVTGDVALSYEEMRLVEGQAITAGVISFVLVTCILLFALRSLRLSLATMLTLVVGLLWTAGFAAFAIGHLNVLSVAFAVLFIGLSVDFGIHVCLRYQELLGSGYPHDEALRQTGGDVGSSLALCALTTSIGFYAFVPTEFAGVAELGLISGTGMFISLFANLTVLPALMSIGRSRAGSLSVQPPVRRFGALPKFPVERPVAVAIATVALAVGSIALLPHAYFDADPLRIRDPAAESVQTYQELVAAGGTSPLDISVIAPGMQAAEQLAERLRKVDVVDKVITVKDYVPTNQAEKLSIIEDVALFLAPPVAADGTEPAPTVDEQVEALRSLRAGLQRLIAEQGGDEELESSARGLERELTDVLARIDAGADAAPIVSTLQASMLGELPDQLSVLERAVNVEAITLDSLPQGLIARMVGSDGSVRVRIVPKEDLSDNEALDRFVEAVQSVTPDATGSAVNVYEASREAVRALRQALTTASVAIAVLLLLIWRTLGDTALVMTPLALAGLFTAAAAVLVRIPFNFADIIVLPLLLGIGVDSGIHLIERSRRVAARGGSLLATSTAYAVLFSALTTIASFGSLGLASHRGMASMGQLLTIGVSLAVVCNLIVLPALIELRTRLRSRRS